MPKGVETWLTPFGEAWTERMGGVLSYPRLARAFKPLMALYTSEALESRWRAYLASEGKWASPERFAATAGLWGPAEGIAEARGDPGPLIVDGWLTEYGDTLTRPR
jgi:hypothetical protein